MLLKRVKLPQKMWMILFEISKKDSIDIILVSAVFLEVVAEEKDIFQLK